MKRLLTIATLSLAVGTVYAQISFEGHAATAGPLKYAPVNSFTVGDNSIKLLWHRDNAGIYFVPATKEGMLFGFGLDVLTINPIRNPRYLEISVDADAKSSGKAFQTTLLFNFESADWDVIDVVGIGPKSSYTYTVKASPYINPTTQEVWVRVLWSGRDVSAGWIDYVGFRFSK